MLIIPSKVKGDIFWIGTAYFFIYNKELGVIYSKTDEK